MIINPHDYTITIKRGNFAGEVCFQARVKELPDVEEYADTHEEAYLLAIDTIETTAEIFQEKGKTMPLPQQIAEDFSGRVTLRVPKSLHRALAEASNEEGVSLNQHLVNILNYYSGYAAGLKTPKESVWQPAPISHKKTVSSIKPRLRVVSSSSLTDQSCEKVAL